MVIMLLALVAMNGGCYCVDCDIDNNFFSFLHQPNIQRTFIHANYTTFISIFN